MKTSLMLTVLTAVNLTAFALVAEASGIQVEWFGGQFEGSEEAVRVEVANSDLNEIQLLFDFAGVELISLPGREGMEVEIPGEGHTSIVGVPSLPKVSRLVAIPAQAKIKVQYQFSDILVRDNVDLLPTMQQPLMDIPLEAELNYNAEIYNTDKFFPDELLELGEPAIMRDLRVVRITVNPVQYNPIQHKLTLSRHIEITLNYENGSTLNVLPAEPTKVSRSFYSLYKTNVVNFEQLDLPVDQQWGTLLIIAPNNPTVLAQVQQLVNWKMQKGIPTILANTSQTGTTASQIQAYIQNIYNTSDPLLEYLILIGDCDGSIAVAPSNSTGDHNYGCLAGGDILADIGVGRFSCDNTTQLATEINKVFSYEKNPFMGSTGWYKKGAVVAGSSLSGISTIQVNQTIRFKALMDDYSAVDTLWYTMGGSVSTFTNNEINSGIGFYNFRGWLGMSGYSTSNITSLTNYFKLPFVATITCGTGDIVGYDDYSEVFFYAGSPTSPIGAIAAIGTATTSTHTKYNNCVDNGIFGAFFDYDIFEFGNALNQGKYDLYMSYPDNPGEVASYSYWNNLIGDPSCQLWTDVPQTMTVDHPDTIFVGTSSLEVTVLDSVSGEALSEVDVCLYGTGINLVGITNEEGEILFSLPSLSAGSFYLTCTKHNFKPHLGQVAVVNSAVFVSFLDLEIDDDNLGTSSGNDDGNINPGETIELGVSLKNYGTSTTATNISSILSTSSEFIIIVDSTANYDNLAPSMVSPIQYGFVITVEPDATDQATLPFNLHISSGQGIWDSYFALNVVAPDMVFQDCEVLDLDNQLDPGDQTHLEISISNNGGLTGENLQATLNCTNSLITILQETGIYGNLAPNQSSADTAFEVSVSLQMLPGTLVHFDLFLQGDNGFSDTTGFNLPVGEVSADDPTGPDEYGYYALDNTDLNITGHPLYSWLEIDPTVPGHIYDGQDVGLTDFGNEQDDTRLLNLPFEFQYYGTVFDQVSICSNGWIAFGDMTYFTDFRNWYLPSSFGPYSMVAPFWDDLYQTTTPARKVYYYYDQTNHRFLVEWNVLNYAPGNPPEIFEVVLFDPLYYTTTSGDGIILFQYQDVANVSSQSTDNHYATVGIKSPDNLIGLQYTYWNDYAPGAANLVDGRAIQFTTQPPLYTSPPVITHTPIPDVTSPTNGYTVSADITGYYQIDEDSVFIFWSTERVGPYNQLILPPAPSATPTDFLGNIPEVEPGNVVYYYLYARDVMGNYTYLPDAAPDEVFSFMVGPQTLVVFDDAETATGWLLGVPGDDATTGIWIRDDPVVSYADNGALVQPEDDHTPDPGHICFVTGNAALGAPGGTNDVDGGQTTLRSPMYDLTGFENILISFWYFYTNDQGLNPSQDYWDVAVSNDSGAIWFSVIHTTGTTNSEWYHYQFWLNDYVSPSNRVLLHFIASDEDGGSLVEACVDDISIINLDTTWGNWAEGEYIPASEIRVEFSDDEIHFSWPPVMDAEVYQLIAGNNPSFDDDQGEIIAEVMNNNVVVKRTSTVGYYRVKVIK